MKLSRSSQAFIALMVLFAVQTFILPVSKEALAIYHLTPHQYMYLVLIVKIPLIAAWSIAFYSYRRLREYATQIKDAPEGGDYDSIAKGTGWLAWGFAIPPVIGAFLGLIAQTHPVFRTVSASYNTYIYLLVTLVGLSYIGSGIHKLARRSSVNFEMKHIRYLVAVLVAMSVLFGVLIATRLHHVTELGDSYNSFYVPNIMVWSTIVFPYLYAWCIGIIAAFELSMVARRTTGVIYKQALLYLTIGLITIIVAMVALQYFRAIIPRTGSLTINGALIMAYAIYAVNAVGSVLLAVGVKRLKRIEDI